MNKTRIENFSDGIFSILITLMVFQFKLPASGKFSDIFSHSFLTMLLTYATSFLIIAGFWIGHHMALANLRSVTTGFLWVNLLALFPTTLIPFSTLTYGTYETSRTAAMFYTGNYVLVNLAILMLNLVIISGFIVNAERENLKSDIFNFARGRVAATFYSSIPILLIAYFFPRFSLFIILLSSLSWIILSVRLDRRVKKVRHIYRTKQ